MGFIPIYLGVKAIIDHQRNTEPADNPELGDFAPDVLSVTREDRGLLKRLFNPGC
ncbi:hypothetical protein [Acetobacterium wieringae]|uniref:hypothetical protein n=1 Tax=Acetobacterium wieringae TaxID=52694 RepID=UPI00315843D3